MSDDPPLPTQLPEIEVSETQENYKDGRKHRYVRVRAETLKEAHEYVEKLK